MRVLALLALLVITPVSHAETAQSFDIRLSDEKSDIQALERLQQQNPTAIRRAEAQAAAMLQAEQRLRALPAGVSLKVADELGTPEVVAPARSAQVLAAASSQSREEVARRFIADNAGLYGLSASQVSDLALDVSYPNPAGNLEWVRFVQRFNDLPVFRGEVTVALTPKREVVRSIGQLAPFINPAEAATSPLVNALDVVRAQFAGLGLDEPSQGIVLTDISPNGRSALIDAGPGNDAIKAELIYFPLGRGVLELAWSMTIEDNPDVWYHVVSATDGTLLFRKNLTDYEAHTYRVYTGGSPAPFIPGPTDPTLGQQAPRAPVTDIVVDSQSASGDPWLDVGVSVTDGNNVEAGLDLSAPNGVDAPLGESGGNEFLYDSNPPPGSPAPGEAANTVNSRNAAVVNLFYWSNRFHDLTYDLGFTEEARNFQNDNYGHGGVAGDRISAEAQDSSGTNNANFATPADGGRGRMQMYVWNSPTPSRDGSMDADIIIHEFAHGLSNRLHANASGLASNMSRGMGEGWGDYYAHSFLSSPSDPVTSIYTTGGYSTYQLTGPTDTSNYYYGIRRFPKAVMAATGGPGNLPFNPLTFADIDSNQMDLSDGAYPRGPVGSATADQVHNAGEIWSTMLWEARGQLVNQHGALAGNQRMLQLVTDGMKLDPVNPTFLDARDAIIAADCAAYAGEDELALWDGFAIRGLGFSAQIVQANSPARVVEAFDTPVGGNLLVAGTTNLSCSLAPRNPVPGETLELLVTLSNTFCATTLDNVVLQIVGGNSVAVGSIAPGGTVNVPIEYSIPGGASCGTVENLVFEVSSDRGTQDYGYAIPVGIPNIGTAEYSNATPVDIPAGQPGTTSGPADPYPSTISVAGFDHVTNPVTGIEVVLNDVHHSWFSDVDMLLVAPNGQSMVILSDVFGNTDPAPGYNITISDAAAATAGTSPPAGTTLSVRPTNHGAGDAFDAPAPAGPYAEPAPAGAATFADFAGIDPNGDWALYIDDDASADSGHMDGGWTLRLLYSQPPICEDCPLTLGGNLTGLAAGNSVTLQNNGGNDLLLNADGGFAFAGNVQPGDGYDVSVSQQPVTVPQLCSVADGSGTVGADNVTSIQVTCVNTYRIGGTLTGLAGGATVTLQNNGGDDLMLGADGAFSFATRIADGNDYAVTVSVQPSSPDQLCSVTSGNGTVASADVNSISVDCISLYSIGGNLSGLAAGNSVTLQNNGGDDLLLSNNGGFAFSTKLLDGSSYLASVSVQPSSPSQTCTVSAGNGTLAGADVTNVSVSCVVDSFNVGGQASGLLGGETVELQLNGGETLVVSANGSFAFAGQLLDEAPYAVTLTSSSLQPDRFCRLSNAAGTVMAADVGNITLECVATAIFADGYE
ncbi:MAG: M36 family metallopeptidase [Xanthomonadales bacterium]|nr:M36 family metallopeptidase [Xanthomonadales bacterium]